VRSNTSAKTFDVVGQQTPQFANAPRLFVIVMCVKNVLAEDADSIFQTAIHFTQPRR
jgi:hypothetical protein